MSRILQRQHQPQLAQTQSTVDHVGIRNSGHGRAREKDGGKPDNKCQALPALLCLTFFTTEVFNTNHNAAAINTPP